jgi:hypothetical protein
MCAANIMKVYFKNEKKPICIEMFIHGLKYINILSRVCGDYIRRVLDWQLDLLDHTQLHTITVYTLIQLTTVHYNTCRVSSLCLHWLPVFQYRRIRSLSELTCNSATLL